MKLEPGDIIKLVKSCWIYEHLTEHGRVLERGTLITILSVGQTSSYENEYILIRVFAHNAWLCTFSVKDILYMKMVSSKNEHRDIAV